MRLRGCGRLFALTLVAVAALLALLVGGAAGGHGKGKPPKPSAKNGRAGFHFLVLDQAGTARLIIQGDGNFNGNRASGGGTFDHFAACTAPPACPLIATGTWRATDVVSWTPGTSHGVYRGGVLIMHATFTPNGKPQIKNVLIEVDCNLGPAGFSTGKPEGAVVTFPGPPQVVFAPTSPTTGVTIFTLGEGHSG